MPRTRDGLSDMDWDKLKVFHAAAEAGSFTHAGHELGLSQSAVSRQIRALEEAGAASGKPVLEVPLLARNPRAMR